MRSSSAVFIIGVGRSGTNLLSQILDGSPDVNFPMEQVFMLKTYRKMYNLPLDHNAKSLFKKYVGKDKFLELLWKVDYEKLFEKIDELPEDTPYHVLCNMVLDFRESVYNSKKEARIFGYHNPRGTFHTENFMDMFPGSKFIYLHRNALDNVSSFKKSGFFKEVISIPFFAYRWKWYNRHCMKLLKKYPDRIFKLAYEDLVSEPEQKLKELCDFLNISFIESMLSFEEKFTTHYQQSMTPEKYHIHSKMTEKINKKSIHNYSKSLSEEEISLVNFVTNSTSKLLGYESQPYKFRFRFLFGFFEAAWYMRRFDRYSLLQGFNNVLFPNKRFIRFKRP